MAGGRAVAAMGDVSDPKLVPGMVEAAAQAMGGIDILVSNAALRRHTKFIEMSFSEWREILAVALDGAFLLARAAVPHMIRRGAIVALSGISTHVGTPERAHVSAARSGLEGLMRALAIAPAPHRITCNAIAPGAINTLRGPSSGPRSVGLGDETIPLRRKGTVGEIAAMVRLLVGPEGSPERSCVTGQTIDVNGGVFLT